MAVLKQLLAEILEVNETRQWRSFHTPKDLAISISLEASELLEHFQWRTSEIALRERRMQIGSEVADVIIYTLLLAHDLEIDIESEVRQKLEVVKKRHPVAD